MPGMKILSELMRELELKLGICMRCGMCQAVCPLFSETGLEETSLGVSWHSLTDFWRKCSMIQKACTNVWAGVFFADHVLPIVPAV